MADDTGVGFDEPELSWSTQDIEQKIGFSGGRYTDTNAFFTFLASSSHSSSLATSAPSRLSVYPG